MNDNFLRNFRQEPPRQMMDALYQQIATMPGDRRPQPVTRGPAARGAVARPRTRLRALAAAALLLLLCLTSLFTPAVRALVEDVVRQIGGLTVRETALYPGGGEAPRITAVESVTLDEARARAGYEFALPSALPERYVLEEVIIVSPAGQTVTVRWRSETVRGDFLVLRVARANSEVEWMVGPDSVEIVGVNGAEAQFIRGGWSSDSRTWDPSLGRDIRWVRDGIQYHLSTGNEFMCPGQENNQCPLSDEDLIRIAESVE
jgi:hypothetical protein